MFGMVIYILGVSVSRATVYLRLGLGLGAWHQADIQQIIEECIHKGVEHQLH